MAKVTPTLGRIHTVVEGECPSLEYRVKFLYDDGAGEVTRISPWHDVPYKNPEDGSYNMVVCDGAGSREELARIDGSSTSWLAGGDPQVDARQV